MSKAINLSFEFFPPKTLEGEKKLQHVAEKLASLKPDFFSVTFGAGGSTREKTFETIQMLQQTTAVKAVPHISCVSSTKTEIRQLLQKYQQHSIKHLVVLRGDLPSGTSSISGDFRHASDLVKFIRQETSDHFFISVAAYPECHPEARTASIDLENFKTKVNAGANNAVTQYFFSADAYFFFIDSCRKNHINIPIIPGIMPILSFNGLQRFSERCGADIPQWIYKRCLAYGEDEKSLREFGLEVVARLCEQLIAGGAPGLHFYTLNQSELTYKLCENF